MIQLQSVSLDDARRIIAAGEAKAREIKSPSNIAVVECRRRSCRTQPHGRRSTALQV